jgi:hypothetical protein
VGAEKNDPARIFLWKIPRQVFQVKNQTTPGLHKATQTAAGLRLAPKGKTPLRSARLRKNDQKRQESHQFRPE